MVPLVAVHLQHIAAAEEDAAGTPVTEHARHHHVHQGGGQHDPGAADPNDQCCTLHHHLTGVLPHPFGPAPKEIPSAANISLPPATLVPADQGTLERPPKLLSSV